MHRYNLFACNSLLNSNFVYELLVKSPQIVWIIQQIMLPQIYERINLLLIYVEKLAVILPSHVWRQVILVVVVIIECLIANLAEILNEFLEV